MALYELLIETPEERNVFVAADDDESAQAMARDSLKADFHGETDQAILASRVTLLPSKGGALLIESTVGEILAD